MFAVVVVVVVVELDEIVLELAADNDERFPSYEIKHKNLV
jgi:hypothetical protein